MRVLRRYTEEFKVDALAILKRSDLSLSAVAHNLGVPPWTLRAWYNKAEMAKRKKTAKPKGSASKIPRFVSPPTMEEETDIERIARLERELSDARKENESLKLDREILKKAAAFFVKESE